MAFQIEKDEGTAARRRVPFRLFTSDGTTPDTGASNDTVLGSANGAAQFSLGSASAISANAGMYYIEPAQSAVSTLGSLAVWYDEGDFPQHVANVQVVNSNPMSTQSNLLVDNIGAGTYSGVTVEVNNIGAGSYSGVTVEVNNAAGDVSSRWTVGVTSGATIAGVTNTATLIGALNDIDGSNVTLHAGVHSGATVAVNDLADGVITTATFGAGALDAAALATDAAQEIADHVLDRDMGTGTDSGSSAVRTLRDAARALRNRVASDATQLYVYEEDDTTIAWTASLNTVASTNNHISGFDPNA